MLYLMNHIGLDHLYRIASLFSSAWYLEEVKRRAIELVCSFLDAESASILLLDPEREGFYFETATGPKGKEIKEFMVPLSIKSIAKLVFESEKTHIYREDDKDLNHHHLKQIDERLKYHTRNMICSIIRVGTEKLGVLQVLNKNKGEFDDADKQMAELLSLLIGQAIKINMQISDIKSMNDEVIDMVTTMIDLKDEYTLGHSKRVGFYASKIGEELGLSQQRCDELRMGGLLHDIGKIGIDDDIIKKAESLTEKEFDSLMQHPKFGAKILDKYQTFKKYAHMAMDHHMQPNERGFPKASPHSKKQYKDWKHVNLNARIISVADTFDAMWGGKEHEDKKSLAEIMVVLESQKGEIFDPVVVDALFTYLHKRFGDLSREEGESSN